MSQLEEKTRNKEHSDRLSPTTSTHISPHHHCWSQRVTIELYSSANPPWSRLEALTLICHRARWTQYHSDSTCGIYTNFWDHKCGSLSLSCVHAHVYKWAWIQEWWRESSFLPFRVWANTYGVVTGHTWKQPIKQATWWLPADSNCTYLNLFHQQSLVPQSLSLRGESESETMNLTGLRILGSYKFIVLQP